jgi:hypothetical protein
MAAMERLRLYGWLLYNMDKLPSTSRDLFEQLTTAAMQEGLTNAGDTGSLVRGTWIYACVRDWLDLDATATYWRPGGPRNKALYQRKLNEKMKLTFEAWVHQQLEDNPQLEEWVQMYGTQPRNWVHQLYQIRGPDRGTPLFTKLRLLGGYPLCLSHDVRGQTSTRPCRVCGQTGIIDEFHLILACKPTLPAPTAARLLDCRGYLATHLSAGFLQRDGDPLPIKAWLSEQGERFIAAWCLGAEELWRRAPWRSPTGIKSKFIRITSRTIDILDIIAAAR